MAASVNPALRNTLSTALSCLVALVAGWEIANEEFMLVGLISGSLFLWFATRWSGQPPDVVLGGLLLIGYLVGNRGFAQVRVPNLPLLAGEVTLGVGMAMAIWRAARTKMLPVRRDLLNGVLLIWFVFGLARLRLDLRSHGFVAARDFALLYYALFFFLAQGWATIPTRRRWIERCLDVAFIVAPPVFIAFTRWPGFFTSNFVVQGVPLIFIKSDVEGGLLVAGFFWFLHRNAEASHRLWLLPATSCLVAVASSNSRAAIVALAGASLWLTLFRDKRLIRPLAAMLTAGALLVLAYSVFGTLPWSKSPAYRLYETCAAIIDTRGLGIYQSEELGDKADNNRFRLTWWRTVVDQTLNESPWFGLGFGYDLAGEFTRVYYTGTVDGFSARSPHNFALTVFGRMGFVGLGLLLALLGGMARLIWRLGRAAARDGTDRRRFVLALGAWAILVNACFGVVLEGPMGATVFWTTLGLANVAAPTGEVDA